MKALPASEWLYIISAYTKNKANVWNSISPLSAQDTALASPERCATYHVKWREKCDGRAQAISAGLNFSRAVLRTVELMVVSPLIRAVETAALMFPTYAGPVELNELCSEQAFVCTCMRVMLLHAQVIKSLPPKKNGATFQEVS